MDRMYSGQEDTGPTSNSELVSSINVYVKRGEYFGNDETVFLERYLTHIDEPDSPLPWCGGYPGKRNGSLSPAAMFCPGMRCL